MPLDCPPVQRGGNVLRSSRSPWKASWRCITKRWRGSRVHGPSPLPGQREERCHGERTVEKETVCRGNERRTEKDERRWSRWWGLQFVARWPSSSPPRCRCPEIKNLREAGRANRTRLAFSSKAGQGNRFRGNEEGERNLLSEGGQLGANLEACWYTWNSVPSWGSSLHALAFRNGTQHCCTLYSPLHKPGTPRIVEIREFSVKRCQARFEDVWRGLLRQTFRGRI